MTPIINKSCFY